MPRNGDLLHPSEIDRGIGIRRREFLVRRLGNGITPGQVGGMRAHREAHMARSTLALRARRSMEGRGARNAERGLPSPTLRVRPPSSGRWRWPVSPVFNWASVPMDADDRDELPRRSPPTPPHRIGGPAGKRLGANPPGVGPLAVRSSLSHGKEIVKGMADSGRIGQRISSYRARIAFWASGTVSGRRRAFGPPSTARNDV